jgi:CMP-N-acetylneuraminic acid synthetase
MINGKKILAVVPARGGSKGILMKNLCTIKGMPLVAIVGHLISSIAEIDRRIVSTDHIEIAKVAKSAGLDAPFLRPNEISGDRVSDFEVLLHALLATEAFDNSRYDIVVMLQPTSPLRSARHVLGAINMLIDGEYDAVWTVSETDSKAHPLKQLVLEKGLIDFWDLRGAEIIARQQLSPVYHRNGVAYAITRKCLIEQRSTKGCRTGGYVVLDNQISIDTEEDIRYIEFILANRSKNHILDK